MAKIAGVVSTMVGLFLAVDLIWPLILNVSDLLIVTAFGLGAVIVFRIGSKMLSESRSIGKVLGIFVVILSLVLTAKFIFGFILSFVSFMIMSVQLLGVWLLIWIGMHWYRQGAFCFPWR